jgi:hypothetical protein
VQAAAGQVRALAGARFRRQDAKWKAAKMALRTHLQHTKLQVHFTSDIVYVLLYCFKSFRDEARRSYLEKKITKNRVTAEIEQAHMPMSSNPSFCQLYVFRFSLFTMQEPAGCVS